MSTKRKALAGLAVAALGALFVSARRRQSAVTVLAQTAEPESGGKKDDKKKKGGEGEGKKGKKGK